MSRFSASRGGEDKDQSGGSMADDSGIHLLLVRRGDLEVDIFSVAWSSVRLGGSVSAFVGACGVGFDGNPGGDLTRTLVWRC